MHKSLRTRLWTGGVTLIGVVAIMYPFIIPPVKKAPDQLPSALRSEVVPDFNQYTQVVDKKKAFFRYLAPEVHRQNEIILTQRTFIFAVQNAWLSADKDASVIQPFQLDTLRAMAGKYDIRFEELNDKLFEQLFMRVDIIPIELVLAQAANESAWGTSRFARQGYNFFGMWCFQKGCGFVPRRRDEEKSHEVARYESLQAGVAKYLNTLNRHFAYKDLRYIRSILRDTQQPVTAEMLAEGLLHYSERGQAYVEELQSMIRVNRKYMNDI